MAHPIVTGAAVITGLVGTGVAANSIGSSPESLPVGCSMTEVVEEGGSWYQVAEQYGMSATSLATMNETSIDEVVHPGDLICTVIGQPGVSDNVSVDYPVNNAFVRDGSNCMPDTEIYEIQVGDGPIKAAESFGFPLQTVYNMNPGLKGSTVYAGDILCSVIDLGDASFSGDNHDAAIPVDSTSEPRDTCKITADVNGDGDTVTDDYADVLAFQKNYNNATGSSIAEDGKRGPKETNGAIKHLQEVVGAGVDCNWGKDSEKLYKAKYVAQTVNASTASPNSSVRAGCEPYHASTQIVLCGSAGQGNEPVELYIRGEDGNMYLQSSAMGRSSRYDNDGSGKEDCITPRNHVKLDKSSMQEESSKGLKYFIPFGDCGGGDGTAFHYYPYLGQNDDSQGCFRTPYDFIKNAYITIQNGGQTEVIVRDK